MPTYPGNKKDRATRQVTGSPGVKALQKVKDYVRDYPEKQAKMSPVTRAVRSALKGAATGGRGGPAMAGRSRAADNLVRGTKRAAGAGRTGETGEMPKTPIQSAKMSARVGAKKMSGYEPGTNTKMAAPKRRAPPMAAKPTRKSQYEEARDRQGDYYLALSGGFGSEPYKKPKKR